MTRFNAYRQGGVALIQVIITTSIIMLLMIFFLGAAKSQVDKARALQDKTQAYLSHYSTNTAVLYRMLTSDLQALKREGWNFYGKPFKSNDDAMVSIQDLNGLLSLAVTSGPGTLARLLAQTLPVSEANSLAASIVDWIDADNLVRQGGAEQNYYAGIGINVRNGPIQSYSELAFIKGMSIVAEQVLLQNTTIHPTMFLNPMVAPNPVLSAYLNNPAIADQVSSTKGTKDHNRQSITDITGLSAEDGLNYLYGPLFRVIIESKVGDSFYAKVLEYEIKPYNDNPVRVLSRLPQQQLAR